jgi:hypothetical protein
VVRCVRNLKIEQHSVTIFYCKFGISEMEASEGLKRVHGNKCLPIARVFGCFAKFLDGR